MSISYARLKQFWIVTTNLVSDKQSDLSPCQLAVFLTCYLDANPQTAKNLATILCVSNLEIARALYHLEELGFIKRYTHNFYWAKDSSPLGTMSWEKTAPGYQFLRDITSIIDASSVTPYDNRMPNADEDTLTLVNSSLDIEQFHRIVVNLVVDKWCDLTARQLAVFLICYLDQEPQTVRGLSKSLTIPSPSTTRAVTCLAKLGLVERKTNLLDRRVTFVETTWLGQRYIENLRSIVSAVCA